MIRRISTLLVYLATGRNPLDPTPAETRLTRIVGQFWAALPKYRIPRLPTRSLPTPAVVTVFESNRKLAA